MESKEEILAKLEGLADDLIRVAERLAHETRHDISMPELAGLQESQNVILEEINRLLQELPIKTFDDGSLGRSSAIKDKFLRFEEANRIFIKNIKRLKGIIHLDQDADTGSRS